VALSWTFALWHDPTAPLVRVFRKDLKRVATVRDRPVDGER